MALSTQRASISTLSAQRSEYDVFLSFRGETRLKFTDHLYHELQRRGVKVFRDHEVEKGMDLASLLSTAIKGSRFAIIVLSPNYASSTWCMQELSIIFECMKDWKTTQRIIPIFYNVEPSDVRKQKGTFDEAFKNHEQNLIEHKTLQQWRTALTEVSGIAGWTSRDCYEAVLITKIVESVYIKLVCAHCKMRIDNKLYLSCMRAVWHPECFRCKACNLQFTDREFWVCGEHPYHELCYKLQCGVGKYSIPENSGTSLEHPLWRQKFFPSLEGNETLKCSSYERLKPKDTRHCLLGDGQNLSLECHESAILDTHGGCKQYGVHQDMKSSCDIKLVDFELPRPMNQECDDHPSKELDADSYGLVASETTMATKDLFNEKKLGVTVSIPISVPATVAKTENFTSMKVDNSAKGPGSRRFSYAELATATKKFLNVAKLCEAGFGVVHSGVVAGSDAVGVKKTSRGFKQTRKECMPSSLLRVRNLLQLIGWLLLLYQFVPNGILEFQLFWKRSPLLICDWTKLVSIGLPFAFLYLRERWKQFLVHWNVKSRNIHSIFKLEFMRSGILDSHLFGKISCALAWATRFIIILAWACALLYLLGHRFKLKFIPNGILDSNLFEESKRLICIIFMGLGCASEGQKQFLLHIKSKDTLIDSSPCAKRDFGFIWWTVDEQVLDTTPKELVLRMIPELDGKGRFISCVDERLDIERSRIEGLHWVRPEQRRRPPLIKQAIQYLNFDAELPTLPKKMMPVPVCHDQYVPAVTVHVIVLPFLFQGQLVLSFSSSLHMVDFLKIF